MIAQFATEWAKYGISVNGIAPALSPKAELAAGYLNDPESHEPLAKRIPLGRVGEPGEVAGSA